MTPAALAAALPPTGGEGSLADGALSAALAVVAALALLVAAFLALRLLRPRRAR